MKSRPLLRWLLDEQVKRMSDGINLMAQSGTARNLEECYALHESLGLPYSKRNWRILPEMWRALLAKGAMQLHVVVNRARVASRVVSFSAVLFVTDEFCFEARSRLPPYLGVELVQQYLSCQLPVLNRGQVAQANAGDGLNLLICFEGWIHDGLSREQLLAVRAKQSAALHLGLSGYHVKELLVDSIGPESSQWMLDAGALLRRDYSNYFRKNRLAQPKSSRRPRLVGLSREEALAHPGGNIAGLFIYTPPRFHFSRSQRMLLQHALMGETCEKAAGSLCLSPWTVKKRWHSIYERVAEIDSQLLPHPIANSLDASSRGAERRRHLLNYLRQHLEELRPFEPSQQRRGS